MNQFPNFTFLALGNAAVAMGVARAAISEMVQLAQSKEYVSSSVTVAARPQV
ncbi:MAG: hypothetical protein QF921_15565 [Pseudomonadales bacterium]|nr:hypothetical protein [Pseudomonadales bacterium]MDP6472789.1 hypothetical protein [Pseudomonadales bacterium]MDP6828002.1 hypothetical protein [Pseudomonadales bacterium]MDP6972901.1 hypothetical protein [Pseudomonadales bacterium]